MRTVDLVGAPPAFDALIAAARGGDVPVPALDDAAWLALPALARRHRMQGLLYRAMHAASWPVPPRAQQEVADDARAAAQESLQRVATLRAIADAASARGIPLLPYKGPALSLVAYGDLGLRSAADLDVLVPSGAAPAATAMLADCGYRPAGGLVEPLHTRLHAHLGATPWLGAGGLVELHWRLCEMGLPWTIDAAELLTRATSVSIAGREFPVPAPDDLLLMLAWHGARHGWEQLEWLAALAALARSHRPDWRALTKRGAAYGGARAVVLAQALLAHWLGAAEAPRDEPWLIEARALIGAQYVRGTTLFAHHRGSYRHFLRLLLERPSDRAALAAAQIFLPTAADGEWLPLPAALWPLYVPLRLVRLTLRAAGRGAPREAAS